jgi:NitT/TauT family transport system ATP-binding protein
MFAVRGVSKDFEKSDGKLFPALQEINLDIRAGELVSIIGPSGCGKTTLLNLIAGFIKPTSGSVLKEGVEIAGPGPDRTMMFQDYALFPWLTIAGNIAFGLGAQKLRSRKG